jgi:hypothetical protein
MSRIVGLIVGVVLLAAAAASVLGLVATGVALYGLWRAVRWLWGWWQLRSAERTAERARAAHQLAELRARAELQHRWYLEGDPRGTYGRHTPATLAG